MKGKTCIVIQVPESISDIPIQIIRNSHNPQLIFSIESDNETNADNDSYEYVFIWQHQEYLKVNLKDITWVEADKSYSRIHLADGRKLTISFNLSSVEKRLQHNDFLRIHRSYLVNMRHVSALMGNSLKIKDGLLTIGKEYRESVLEHFIFLGVRRNKPK